MAAPYSIDLREKVLTKYESGDYAQEEIATLFSIGISSIKRWLKKKRETGNILTPFFMNFIQHIL